MHAIAPDLFTEESQPRLVGGVSHATGRIVFPCPPGKDYEPHPLAREGSLWSYTIQRYRPKSPPYAGPEAFEPWAVAYVELPGETIVESRLANVAFEDIRIGMDLELTFVPLDPASGDPVMIHAFQPRGAGA
jgi:uncharacterized OB-fold protein